jgi:hypothetical protein
MSYINIWKKNGLLRQFSGHLSGEEILESNFELHSHPEFKNILYIINDFTQITGHTVEIRHTEIYANTDSIISNTKGRLHIALVVPQPEFQELALHYCKLMESQLFTCQSFQTMVLAESWLESATKSR